MAGHSKWANIKHRKAAQDAKRGKLFTKLIRELVVAARAGGAAVEDNPRLRAAVDKALGANMKRDTIDNAIARGAGTGEVDNMEELTYEGYAPGGVAVLVEVMTDNRNRTVAEVRHAFSKAGGNLGTSGSVDYMFQKLGVINFSKEVNKDALMEAALDAGADDIIAHADGSFEVLTQPEEFMVIRDRLVELEFTHEQAEVTLRADNLSPVSESDAEKILRLLDALDELDDVQNVYSNADFSTLAMKDAE